MIITSKIHQINTLEKQKGVKSKKMGVKCYLSNINGSVHINLPLVICVVKPFI